MVPWLAAAIFIGGLNVVVELAGVQPSLVERVAMILALSASLAVAGLVAARSSREAEAADRRERARPGDDELLAADNGFGGHDLGPSTYFEFMERWAEAMLELTKHAAATPKAIETGTAGALTTASDDTSELRELLRAGTERPLSVNGMATLHNICSLWEADQGRLEQLAADADPAWHRRWRARSVVERLLRRGGRQPEPMALPYG
jgi:hypothetical protein